MPSFLRSLLVRSGLWLIRFRLAHLPFVKPAVLWLLSWDDGSFPL